MNVFSRRVYALAVMLSISSLMAYAQNRPVGYWRSLLPYNIGAGLASDGTNVYGVCPEAFFSLSASNPGSTMTTYSKVEGMSDIGMQCAAFDGMTGTLVLIYTDGNIDLFKEKESTFYNVPDLYIKAVSGSKQVYGVYTMNGMAYISSSLGVLVLDLTTHNFVETYQFTVNNQSISIYGFTGSGGYFYAITSAGLYRADQNNPELQNFQVWQLVDSNTSYSSIASVGNTLFMANSNKVNALVDDTIQTVYVCPDTDGAVLEHIDSGSAGLLVSEFYPDVFRGAVLTINDSFRVSDSFVTGDPQQAVSLPDGTTWVADNYYGLGQRTPGSLNTQYFVPPGPSGPYNFDIFAYNKDVWIAHGGYNQDLYASPTGDGVSNFNNEKWTHYLRYVYPPFDTVDDFVAVVKDESNGTVYMGSFLEGLFTLHPNGAYSILNANSILAPSAANFYDNQRQIFSMALDQQDNLWLTEAFPVGDQLYVKTADSNWYGFHIPGITNGGAMVVDNNGIVWFAASGGEGVVAYNDNGTPSDPSDDAYYNLVTGVGTGNLPSNNVYSLAVDLNNNIWIGTDNGIGIVSNCTFGPGTTPSCDAQLPIVQYDLFAGYLFAGYTVTSIAVDGANRKWVGTDDGVWLLSPNANAIVYSFNTSNSPLPSNNIQKIAIDKITGDVYIGTDQGLVSFHSTATQGDTSDNNVLIFPNPVPTGYDGTIAIKGLSTDADVRITDINGRLVYKTTALGGQAVWNGVDYKGHRPQSGVYLVFSSSSDGSQTYAGKIVFIQ